MRNSPRSPTGSSSDLIPMAEHLAGSDDTLVRPRGVVFVIAPANVEVMFVYGWLLITRRQCSLCVCHRSGVRSAKCFSTSPPPGRSRRVQVSDCRQLGRDLQHNEEFTAKIARLRCPPRLGRRCDGGTDSRIPLKPVAVDVAFADRFSFAVFAGDAMCRESDSDFARGHVCQRHSLVCPAGVFVAAGRRLGGSKGSNRRGSRPICRFTNQRRRRSRPAAALMSRVTDLFMLAGSSVIDRLATPLSSYPARASGVRRSEGFVKSTRDMGCSSNMRSHRSWTWLVWSTTNIKLGSLRVR